MEYVLGTVQDLQCVVDDMQNATEGTEDAGSASYFSESETGEDGDVGGRSAMGRGCAQGGEGEEGAGGSEAAAPDEPCDPAEDGDSMHEVHHSLSLSRSRTHPIHMAI